MLILSFGYIVGLVPSWIRKFLLLYIQTALSPKLSFKNHDAQLFVEKKYASSLDVIIS